MTATVCEIVSIGLVGPADRFTEPLDEMIFDATAEALGGADMHRQDIDLVCMAASDLYDGRGISTMTLTESTGSLGAWEYRVCDDSLVALDLAAAHIDAGYSKTATVCSWCKGSDIVDPAQIAQTAVEPFQRDLGIPPEAFVALATGNPNVTHHPQHKALRDVAISVIIRASSSEPTVRLLGHRRTAERYLHPADRTAKRLAALVTSVARDANVPLSDVTQLLLCGDLVGCDIGEALDVAARDLNESEHVGYASGLMGIRAAAASPPGRYAIASSAGIACQLLGVTMVQVTA